MAYQSALLGPPVPLPEVETRWLYDLVAGFEAEANQKELEKTRSHP
jgi:hypothetical protein